MNEIQKKLHIAKMGVRLGAKWHGFKYMRAVRDAHEKGVIELVASRTEYKWDKWDFKDPQSTSTYDDCLMLNLSVDEEITLVIFNGDSLYGDPTTHRVTFAFKGQWWKIKYLVEAVESQFKAFCLHKLIKQEEEARNKRAASLGFSMLSEYEDQLEALQDKIESKQEK